MGNRTPDLFHAMEALYQLSYSPVGVVSVPPHTAGTESAEPVATLPTAT
jgi:hypothetical protein